jgi:hypothetical protein
MQTRGILNDGKRISYALGLEMGSYRGLPVVEHGGALFGYRTEILRFPDQRFTVLCLCNLANAGPGKLARQVSDVYLEKYLQKDVAPAAPPPLPRVEEFHPTDAALSAYAGIYKSAELDATYKLSIEHGDLMLRVNWNPALKLTAIVPDEFDAGDFGTLVFKRDANSRVSGLAVFAGRIRNVSFEKTD